MAGQAKSGMHDENFILLQDLWFMALKKWRWFLVSVLITMSVAIFYIARSTPIYMRSASLLIKEDNKNIGGENNAFANLDIFKTNTNINNEILALQSPALMSEVVEKLSLNINYSIRDGIRQKPLYKQSPIKVVFADTDQNHSSSFLVKLSPSKLELSDFTLHGKSIESQSIVTKLNTNIETPLGIITIQPNENYAQHNGEETILVNKETLQTTTSHYASTLQVTLGNEDASIVNLSISDVSINRAEDILNALIAVYNDNWIEDKNQIAVSTSEFIDKRLTVIENELGHVDNDISTFKSRNLLPDIQAATSMYMAQSSSNNNQLLSLNNQLSVAQFIKSHIKEHAKHQLVPANLGLENLNTESIIGEYNTLLLRRNNLLNNSSDKNPLLKDMDENLGSMRASMLVSIDNLIASLKLQINNIRQSENQTTQQIASNPSQAKYLLSVERQQKVKEALYLYLLQKREENQLSQAFTAYNSRVINPPSGSATPVSPQKARIILIALAIGFIAPALLISIFKSFDISVRSKADLKNLNIPFIGEIPLYTDDIKYTSIWRRPSFLNEKRTQRRKLKIVVEEKNRNYINEAFRVMRTNLEFMTGGAGQNRTILLTSFNSNSGKTFISSNLGISFSLAGKKVVVLDLDMRKADLSQNSKTVDYGAADYLGGFIDNPDSIIIKKSALDYGPDIVPVGTVPPNPTELLLSDRLAILLEYLRTRYDYILIDCPPTNMVADPAIIEKQVDLTIFVIRSGLLDKRMLPELEEIYKNKQFKNMVITLNGSASSRNKYGYYYE